MCDTKCPAQKGELNKMSIQEKISQYTMTRYFIRMLHWNLKKVLSIKYQLKIEAIPWKDSDSDRKYGKQASDI